MHPDGRPPRGDGWMICVFWRLAVAVTTVVITVHRPQREINSPARAPSASLGGARSSPSNTASKLRAPDSKYLMMPLIKSRKEPPSLTIESLVPLAPHGIYWLCLPPSPHSSVNLQLHFLFPSCSWVTFFSPLPPQGLINVPGRQEPFCISYRRGGSACKERLLTFLRRSHFRFEAVCCKTWTDFKCTSAPRRKFWSEWVQCLGLGWQTGHSQTPNRTARKQFCMHSRADRSAGQVELPFIGFNMLLAVKNGILTLRLDGSGFHSEISDNTHLSVSRSAHFTGNLGWRWRRKKWLPRRRKKLEWVVNDSG